MTEYDRSCWSLGQTVLVRRDRMKTLSPETITGLGRKWASLGIHKHARFDVNTGWLDGATGSGRVYRTEGEHEIEVEMAALWRKIRDTVGRFRMPDHITLPALKCIAAELGIEKE